MKKGRRILLAAVLAAAAGSTVGANETADDILQKIADVNTADVLLKNHESVEFLSMLYDMDSEDYTSYYYYVDENTAAYENQETGVAYCGDGEAYGYREDLALPYRCLFVGDAYREYLAEMSELPIVAFQEEETVVSMSEEDGVLSVVGELPDETAKALYKDYEIVQEMGETDTFHTQYKLDPDTYELYEIISYIEYEDGSTLVVDGARLAYDVERYQPDIYLLDELDGEEYRTVMVIADLETEQRKLYSKRIRKGGVIRVILPEGYHTLYLDRDCTQPADEEQGDLQENAVYYIKEGK